MKGFRTPWPSAASFEARAALRCWNHAGLSRFALSMPPNPMLILLVEDEPLVRWIAYEGLEDAGYDVLAVESAEKALEVLRTRLDVGVLFTDVDMPGGLDGLSLAELVHRAWPAVKLVVTSGRGIDRDVPDDGEFLNKPYSFDDLQAAIVKAGGKAPAERT